MSKLTNAMIVAAATVMTPAAVDAHDGPGQIDPSCGCVKTTPPAQAPATTVDQNQGQGQNQGQKQDQGQQQYTTTDASAAAKADAAAKAAAQATGGTSSSSTGAIANQNQSGASANGGSININNPVAAGQAAAADTGIHAVVTGGGALSSCSETKNGRDISVQVIVAGAHLGGGSKSAPLKGVALQECQSYNAAMMDAEANATAKVETVRGRYSVQVNSVMSDEPCVVRATVTYSTLYDAPTAHSMAVSECMAPPPPVPMMMQPGRQRPVVRVRVGLKPRG